MTKVYTIRCFYCSRSISWSKGCARHCEACDDRAKREAAENERAIANYKAKAAAEGAKK